VSSLFSSAFSFNMEGDQKKMKFIIRFVFNSKKAEGTRSVVVHLREEIF